MTVDGPKPEHRQAALTRLSGFKVGAQEAGRSTAFLNLKFSTDKKRAVGSACMQMSQVRNTKVKKKQKRENKASVP